MKKYTPVIALTGLLTYTPVQAKTITITNTPDTIALGQASIMLDALKKSCTLQIGIDLANQGKTTPQIAQTLADANYTREKLKECYCEKYEITQSIIDTYHNVINNPKWRDKKIYIEQEGSIEKIDTPELYRLSQDFQSCTPTEEGKEKEKKRKKWWLF